MALFKFGCIEVDGDKFELRTAGAPVKVQRIVFETLLFLAERAGRIVTRRDLAQGPWNGLNVGTGSISRAIMLARRAIGDIDARLIVTVHGVGYRLDATEPGTEDHAVPSRVLSAPAMHPQQSWGLAKSKLLKVGYQDALARLLESFDGARHRRPRIVVVSGEAGIGKTTLVAQFARQLDRTALVACGHCCSRELQEHFTPWIEILGACRAALFETEVPGNVSSAGEALTAVLAELVSLRRLASTDDRAAPGAVERTCDRVFSCLRTLSGSWPLVLVIEDIHSADAYSLMLLEFLQRRLREMSTLVVVTLRSTEYAASNTFFPGDEDGPHVLTLALQGEVRAKTMLRHCEDRNVEAIG